MKCLGCGATGAEEYSRYYLLPHGVCSLPHDLDREKRKPRRKRDETIQRRHSRLNSSTLDLQESDIGQFWVPAGTEVVILSWAGEECEFFKQFGLSRPTCKVATTVFGMTTHLLEVMGEHLSIPSRCMTLTWKELKEGSITANITYSKLEHDQEDRSTFGECMCCEKRQMVESSRKNKYINCSRCRAECICNRCRYKTSKGKNVCGMCLKQCERDEIMKNDTVEAKRLGLLQPWLALGGSSNSDSSNYSSENDEDHEPPREDDIRCVRRMKLSIPMGTGSAAALRHRRLGGNSNSSWSFENLEEVD